MTLDMARTVADSVLFEGYLLYPYRASALKNQMRWQFGVLAPPTVESESCSMRAECLIESDVLPSVDVNIRFLQLRTDSRGWDEGMVREVPTTLEHHAQRRKSFDIPGRDSDSGEEHQMRPLTGTMTVSLDRIDGRVWRLRVVVRNQTEWLVRARSDRSEMLRRSMVSTHLILTMREGLFLSQLDPPGWVRPLAGQCRNDGVWPVLVGATGSRDVMLCSPIILYDHPAVAAESPGDLFDATEIDEILTLRTMALTDAEKHEARQTDPRAAALIERTDNLSQRVLERLHGTVRFPGKEG